MKKFGLGLVTVAAAALMAGPVMAQGTPSAKAAFSLSNINFVLASSTSGGTTDAPVTDDDHDSSTILSTIIKAPKHKDLVMDISLECGNFTQTEVKSKGGVKDTSTAGASVRVGVVVSEILNDGSIGASFPAFPSGNPDRTFDTVFGTVANPTEGVVFCKRTQQLEAVFQGIIDFEPGLVEVLGDGLGDEDGVCDADTDPTEICEPQDPVDAFHGCLITDPVTGNVVIDPECLVEEELNLIVDQMTASSFNFIAPDLPESGVYRIDVLAWLDTGAASQNGSAEGKATIGLGSMFVETVRLAKGTEPADVE